MRAERLTSILVADDDRLVRITLRKILESAGYSLFEAKDGGEAVDVYRKRRPDLVILDIVMPIKDGVRTFLELRGLDSKAKIIAMSAGARSGKIDYLSLTKRIGADGILTKPFNRASVLNLVGEILAGEKTA
jgi:two-component system, chemotaxis family, chemotaxis protein CheY